MFFFYLLSLVRVTIIVSKEASRGAALNEARFKEPTMGVKKTPWNTSCGYKGSSSQFTITATESSTKRRPGNATDS